MSRVRPIIGIIGIGIGMLFLLEEKIGIGIGMLFTTQKRYR